MRRHVARRQLQAPAAARALRDVGGPARRRTIHVTVVATLHEPERQDRRGHRRD